METVAEMSVEMMIKLAQRGKKGFLAIEYTVLIAIVVAALIGMQVYVKRAICGKWRTAADSFGHGRQYAPGITNTSH